ncbi:MAG: RNA 2'-phosphotransferase [Candidatus Aenigmatarchaeota archaeon]
MDKVDVSKQMSYWLRHEPEGLEMDKNGFVEIEDLVDKLEERFPDIDREFVESIVEEGKKRYEIKDDKIRALYGHSLDIEIDLPEDEDVEELYHGTTSKAAYKILLNGLEARDRNMVHLSSAKDIAREVGERRTDDPVLLKIDCVKARENGIKFYKANDELYLSEEIPTDYIEKCDDGVQ